MRNIDDLLPTHEHASPEVDSYEGLKVRTPIGLNRKGAKSDEHEHAVQLAVSQCKGLGLGQVTEFSSQVR